MVENLKDFLQETRYCDFKHPLIQRTARELTQQSLTNQEKAVVLFNYVRDRIRYQFGRWSKKASVTLREGRGMCTNSANLFIALLRANEIPAGYGIMKVRGPNYLGSLVLPIFQKKVSPRSVHIYSQVFLNGKWVKADPTIDLDFSKKVNHLDPSLRLAYWNGKTDQLLEIKPSDVFEDIGPLANIDNQLDKKPRHAKGIPLTIANLYLEFLRQNAHRIKVASMLQESFLSWLKRKYPFYYFLLKASLRIKKEKK